MRLRHVVLRPGHGRRAGSTVARRYGRGRPLFGDDRLAAALSATHGRTAAETLDHLWRAACEHAGGHAVDDTALMLLRVTPRT
ncbi:SpoIIE family protein phosphatase [Streptomyces sp. SP18ES09]|uniref:SpoIIE family protein phosphatase n=1 Tax=Streptomyces sp. SP18ES09 TaxID=3002532 RepID=UPI002E7A8B86|nr:SpoIIE family protein phosphatase [Streptomyces sp. SP18ES09]MEE1815149.1 SpoIIE family protein phosphatase [Streptomyces sp. SP18ES09]